MVEQAEEEVQEIEPSIEEKTPVEMAEEELADEAISEQVQETEE